MNIVSVLESYIVEIISVSIQRKIAYMSKVHFNHLIFPKDTLITSVDILSSTRKCFLQDLRDVFEAGVFIIFVREGYIGIPENSKT